ncbi:MAG: 30S ribosomal protein S13 [Candidatus Yonathbacteria bacterium RIFCSPLOWO2_01_FULL_43_27]|uniref:Small ribosomal subunit protein uS13 n=2 Tax=Parcubacteria group TaxID=1794811 RepID=A0A1G2SD42_9BACT|nr:MAG: 30S ribosomal protein S13 [Candidatus Azambacteria bacterium GW2011_GWA1_44_9]OHA78853.1 MAG: 30S ribosomal protein S13 [Candidatus Yonathbacteria bacterium RIFCSPHIGHO2_01_FULL_44_19]OHA82930.1 MAG: 30S ribosomal protein S13 [Candidatus Yonathbacteria bacterium RIFCSPLOWO2_01_FULL_43_27]
MRILGITIPDEKRLEISLTAVYGIGRARAKKILDAVKIDYGTRAKELTADDEAKIRKEIEAFTLEGDLKREISMNVKRLKDIHAYRGTRHAKKLPVRGQRTKTNSRTVRGNVRKTMGSGRRKADKK